jgi:hypothetical protein
MSLQDKGIHVPIPFWFGTRTTLYHHANMRYSVARKLYKTGFRDLDTQDQEGTTPLVNVLAGSAPQYRLILWYLGRGADHDLRKNQVTSGPHLFSHSHAFALAAIIWNEASWSQASIMGIFQHLSEVCGAEIPDQCSCWCSSSGCLPAGIVLRHTCNMEDEQRRRRWLFHLHR